MGRSSSRSSLRPNAAGCQEKVLFRSHSDKLARVDSVNLVASRLARFNGQPEMPPLNAGRELQPCFKTTRIFAAPLSSRSGQNDCRMASEANGSPRDEWPRQFTFDCLCKTLTDCTHELGQASCKTGCLLAGPSATTVSSWLLKVLSRIRATFKVRPQFAAVFVFAAAVATQFGYIGACCATSARGTPLESRILASDLAGQEADSFAPTSWPLLLHSQLTIALHLNTAIECRQTCPISSCNAT